MGELRQEIKLILVEPSGPINIGSVARLCENFGIKELRLVAPRCDPFDAMAIKMAVKGKKLLESAQHYPSLLDAISDCCQVIATCGRTDHGTIPLCGLEEAIKWSQKTSEESPLALIFGREDRGLTNQELLLAQKVLTLETLSGYQSLNLSHAVAIVLHELHRSEKNRFTYKQIGENENDPASPLQVNDCLKDAERLLLEIGFLFEHTAKARMSKIRALIQRAEIRPAEVSLIRGVLRQVRWAIENQNS